MKVESKICDFTRSRPNLPADIGEGHPPNCRQPLSWWREVAIRGNGYLTGGLTLNIEDPGNREHVPLELDLHPGCTITVPPLGMVRSAQIWKGLFAAIHVTVSPGPGIGGRLQAARSGLAAKIKPTAITSSSACRSREGMALPRPFKVFSNLGGSGVSRRKGGAAEQIDRLRSRVVFMMIALMCLGYWIVVSAANQCLRRFHHFLCSPLS